MSEDAMLLAQVRKRVRFEAQIKDCALDAETVSLALIRRAATALYPIRGVYFLFCGDTVVYVGKATNVYARLNDHTQYPAKLATAYTFLPVPHGDLDAVEQKWIKKLKPLYNIAHNGPGARARREAFLAGK